MTTIIVPVAIIAVMALVVISIYNGFITVSNKMEEAFATMDAYLKRRRDLIPNIVETVKGYAAHEKQTFESVIHARNSAMKSNDIKDLSSNENAISQSLKSIFALSESYPELKANENFLNLQNQIETDILQSRKYYNAVVKEFNTKQQLFPQSFIARMMKLEKKEYFEIDSPDRENIDIAF